MNGDKLPEPAVLKVVPAAPVGEPDASAPQSRFDVLFAHLYPAVYGLVYRILGDRMEAEDTLQEAFLKLADEAELQRQDEAAVGAWLRRVALNLAFNRLRAARRARARLERVGQLELGDEADPLSSERSGPPNVLLRHEEREAVRRALAELADRQRECLLLRHSGYSYAEIAATLGIAIGSVGVLLARAERAFRATYRRQTEA